MNLIYFDESGNTGNAKDDRQPVFVLCALMIESDEWQAIESELNAARASLFPDATLPSRFEVHGTELTNPRKSSFFYNHPPERRLQLYHDWMKIAASRKLKVFYRAIGKKRYARWLSAALGPDAQINPQIAAFVLLAQIINKHLASLTPSTHGIFISDESQEVMRDIEEAIRMLRLDSSVLRLSQVIEKGFFIQSHKSLLLQLCDLCVYSLRKREDEKLGKPLSATNQQLAALVDPLIYRGPEAMPEVLTWLQAQYSPTP